MWPIEAQRGHEGGAERQPGTGRASRAGPHGGPAARRRNAAWDASEQTDELMKSVNSFRHRSKSACDSARRPHRATPWALATVGHSEWMLVSLVRQYAALSASSLVFLNLLVPRPWPTASA